MHYLDPEACYICGYGEHAQTEHKYWSNSDAEAEFMSADSRIGDAKYFVPAEYRVYGS